MDDRAIRPSNREIGSSEYRGKLIASSAISNDIDVNPMVDQATRMARVTVTIAGEHGTNDLRQRLAFERDVLRE